MDMAAANFFEDVTLLITHYNRSASLERLLKACAELQLGFGEIIVSDDCSSEEHLSALKKLSSAFGFRLITAPVNGGLGNNINKGQREVKTPYTLYVQEDFVPLEAFANSFKDALSIMERERDLDIIRFYSYIRYPHLEPYEKGFSRMVYKPYSPFYYKIYYYTDHPHLRRSNFLDKFGPYTEGVSVDRSEYRMCISFIQQGGKGLFYNKYHDLFVQKNPETEPSTTRRDLLTMSKNPLIKLVRDIYRQVRYNYDLRALRPTYGWAINSQQARLNPHGSIFTSFARLLVVKILSAWVKLRYPNVPVEYRQFYKDTYYCQLVQLRYIVQDFLIRKKYKVVSFNGEFAPEIQFALPFAYWHYKNGTLKQTRSSKFTRELYFFSENHEESFDSRSNDGNYTFEIPRILYSHNYNMSKWARVPLKETYQNDIFVYDKPLLIIANRYNMEWNAPPVSFLSISTLDKIISKLKDNFTIVYNRPRAQNIITDDSELYDLNEFEWLRQTHPDVLLMEDLYKDNLALAKNFNHMQLMVYANADHFISTHGGTSALASYFGGINLILSKKGPEHHFNCYNTLYPMLSGAKILHARSDEELEGYIDQYYYRRAEIAV